MGLLKDISYVNSLPEALMLVDAGEYDYTLAPYPLGMMVMDEKAVKHVKVAGPPILPSVYCIAVKEGDHELLTMLNHAVSQIRNDGTLDKIDSKWILYKRQDERYKHLLYIVLIILFVLFVVSVMVVVWYYSLRKQVRKETHQIDLVKKNYRNIFNSANDGMIIFDFKGRIVAANPSARNMYAYSEEEMIGLIGRELISEPYQHLFDEFLSATSSGQNFYAESVDKKKNGTLIQTDLKGAIVLFENKEHLLLIVRDISEYIRSKKELEEAKEMAESANRLKSAFFSNISHEIRTPLNAILGYSYILKNSELTIEQKDYIDKLTRSSKTLLSIIEDVLDISKIESGKFELDIAEFNLGDVLQQVSDIVAVKAHEKGLDIIFTTDADVPQRLIGDSLRLQQVLLNLCNNAIKFTLEGYITVRVSTEQKADERIRLLFTVTDTGIGIQEENINRIFGSFEQITNDSQLVNKGGTGLGLTICRHLVNLMHGEIWVKSLYGQGSAFYFTAELVVGKVVNDHTEKQREVNDISRKTLNHSGAALENIQVLLVDDNEFNLQVTSSILKMKGVKVTTVSDAESAIDLLETDKAIHLVLMDLQLPGISGYEAAKRIRKIPAHEKTPVIALSAYNFIREKEKYLACGMNDYLAKPIDPDALFSKIAAYTASYFKKETEHKTLSKGLKTGQKKIHLDAPRVLGYLDGNLRLYHKFLKKYFEQYANLPVVLQNAFENNRYHDIKIVVHNLKNAFGTIGAYQLMDDACEIENMIIEDKKSDLKLFFPSFIRNISDLNDEVKNKITPDSDQ